jgi:hypothetical protein
MLLLSLGACMEEQEDLTQVSNLPPQLAQVKQWFEANKGQLRIRDGGASFRTESQELILPFFEKEPDWERVHQYSFPDGREVFEISLANAQKYFPAYLRDSLQTQDPAGAVIQNIMFVKNPETGRFDPLIARYYPNSETSIHEFGDIHYNDIPLGWSGLVDIWTYDERFFVAFAIEDGEITRVFQRVPHEMDNGRKKLPPGQNYDVTCQYYQVTYLAYTVTAGGLTTEHLEYGIVYECSGGSLPTGPTPVIYTYGPTSSPSGTYGGVGGSTPTYETVNYSPPPVPAPMVLQIDMRGLLDCHKEILQGLIGGTQHELRRIFEKFNANQPVPISYNVKFQYGECAGFPDATSCNGSRLSNGFAQITINKDVNTSATDLSLARTIMHEMLHAYLLFEENYPSNCDINCLIGKYIYTYGGSNLNPAHHALFVETKFLNDIAAELKNYATHVGYNVNALGTQFFKDMAWGGLHETNVFKSLPIADQLRINNRIRAELENKNQGSTAPMGTLACD